MQKEEPKTFEVAAALLHSSGRNVGQAITEAKERYPELYKDYLKRMNDGESDKLSVLLSMCGKGKVHSKFEDAVAMYYAQGRNKTESIMEAIKNFPDLHTNYLKRVNKGEKEGLANVFGK